MTALSKWYVSNDKIRVIVLANSPILAISKALRYCGFKDATEIPDTIIGWDYFSVSEAGFRPKPSTLDLFHPNPDVIYIEKGEALDWFDSTIMAEEYKKQHFSIDTNQVDDYFHNFGGEYDTD